MRTRLTFEVATKPSEIEACRTLRRQIFVEEQGIPEALDADGLDGAAVHVLVRDGEQPVATGRLVIEPTRAQGVLARIAVIPSHRGCGLGPRIVRRLEIVALERGARSVSLEPHRHLEEFYRRLGYHIVEGVSTVGRHELITMAKALDRAAETGGAGEKP